MAILAGHVISTANVGARWPTSSNRIADVLDEKAERLISPVAGQYADKFIPSSMFLITSKLLITPEPVRKVIGSALPASYWYDVYDTVHILPSEIDLGDMLSSQERTVEVWNAYLTEQLLSSITPVGDGGLTLTEPQAAPTTFTQLESRVYTLNISTIGPSVINADYTFSFPSDAAKLNVTGRRVLAFPFPPNFSQALIERLSWKTDVLSHYDGSEQRIKQRQVARMGYEYRLTALGVNAQRLKAMLWGWQARVFAVPVWTDEGVLQASANADDLVLNINTDDLDYHAGGFVVLLSDTYTLEVVEIESLTATTITLANGLGSAWSAGTKVYPARLARIASDLEFKNTLQGVDGVVSFDVVDSTNAPAVDFSLTYRGLPVLNRVPNKADGVSTAFKRDMEILDNMTGVVTYDDRSGFANTLQDYHWIEKGRANITLLKQWLYARAGRLTPFWVSNWTNDIELARIVADSDLVIDITYIGYASHLSQGVGRRDIKIELTDGTVFYRRITDSVDNGDQTETLSIDLALGQVVNPSDIKIISFMQLHRLDSDTIEIAWRQTDLAECSHLVRGLNYDV